MPTETGMGHYINRQKGANWDRDGPLY